MATYVATTTQSTQSLLGANSLAANDQVLIVDGATLFNTSGPGLNTGSTNVSVFVEGTLISTTGNNGFVSGSSSHGGHTIQVGAGGAIIGSASGIYIEFIGNIGGNRIINYGEIRASLYNAINISGSGNVIDNLGTLASISDVTVYSAGQGYFSNSGLVARADGGVAVVFEGTFVNSGRVQGSIQARAMRNCSTCAAAR
jgi:hypothetical protein